MASVSFKERMRIPKYNEREAVVPGRIAFNYEECTGCGLCRMICPASAIVMNKKRPEMIEFDKSECMFCGDCAAICPADAITLVSPNRYGGRFKTIEQGEALPPRL